MGFLESNYSTGSGFLSKRAFFNIYIYIQGTMKECIQIHAGSKSTVPSHPVGEHGWRGEDGDRRIRHTERTLKATYRTNDDVHL